MQCRDLSDNMINAISHAITFVILKSFDKPSSYELVFSYDDFLARVCHPLSNFAVLSKFKQSNPGQ